MIDYIENWQTTVIKQYQCEVYLKRCDFSSTLLLSFPKPDEAAA